MSETNDLIRAMDKRAQRAIDEFAQHNLIASGEVIDRTASGASVRLDGSGRYLRDVSCAIGVNLTVGIHVILTRAGRSNWVIIAAVGDQSIPDTPEKTPIIAQVADFAASGQAGFAVVSWKALYADVRCYELMINTSASESGATTIAVDNSQYSYFDDPGTYYFKARAVGPDWRRGAWSDWASATITAGGGGGGSAEAVTVNTTNFGGVLSSADDTVQKALDTLDDLPVGTASEPGLVELATVDEVKTGTDAERAVTPAGLAGIVKLNTPASDGGIIKKDAGALTLTAAANYEATVPATMTLAGRNVANTFTAHQTLAAGYDLYPNADGAGLARRFINQAGLTAWTAHFRPGETTGPGNGSLAAYSWASSPFVTPTSLYWSSQNDYGKFGDGSGTFRAFLYYNISNSTLGWNGKRLYGRFRTGFNTAIGLRLDNGTDANWVEIFVTGALGNATQRLDFMSSSGGLVSSSLIIPCDTLITIQLHSFFYFSGGTYFARGYLMTEDAETMELFNVEITSWVPSAGRAGLIIRNDTGIAGSLASCDWFYSTFT